MFRHFQKRNYPRAQFSILCGVLRSLEDFVSYNIKFKFADFRRLSIQRNLLSQMSSKEKVLVAIAENEVTGDKTKQKSDRQTCMLLERRV